MANIGELLNNQMVGSQKKEILYGFHYVMV